MSPRRDPRPPRSVAVAVALALAACRAMAPNPPSSGTVDASLDAGADAQGDAGADPSAQWAQAHARFVTEIVSAKEGLRAFSVGDEILVARLDAGRFRVARLAKDKLVDEDAWSRGLPAPQKSQGEPPFSCNRIDGIFGRFPDRLWLVENSGGSMTCQSTFGEYVVWRRSNGSWTKDAKHSPPPGKPAGGVFATWPLGPGVLGVGISNLVGDTLTAPVDAMWTLDTDPWATRAHLQRDGWNILSVCASATGTVAALSVNAGRFELETVRPDRSRTTAGVPPPHAPEGPCAVSDKDLLLVEPPAAPSRRETWLLFDRTAGIGTPTPTPITVPWKYRTARLHFIGARVMAWTSGADGRTHVLLSTREHLLQGKHDAPAWTEVAGMPDGDVEIITTSADDELLLVVDGTKLLRVGLPRQ